MVRSLLTTLSDGFGKVRGQGGFMGGREALSMEWMSRFLRMAAAGSCTGGKMDPLFCGIPSSRHISPRGWHWSRRHKARASGGTWQLAPMLLTLKYSRHERSGTPQPLQIPGALQQGSRNTGVREQLCYRLF